MSPLKTILLVGAAIALAACGSEAATDAGPAPGVVEPTPVAEEPAPAAEPAATFDGPPAVFTLSPVGDEMRYATTEFSAAPGQEVRITFSNTATSAAMQHNVVVLLPGTDVNAFGQAAMSATDTDFVPPSMSDRVVAHTPMLAPGQSAELVFTAPSTPGEYPFICTFPGHYMVMQGVLRIG